MNKHYFSSLDKIQKIDFIWNYGEALHEIETLSTYNSLFILHDFFVEIKLCKNSNEIISIAVQEDRSVLYFYVKGLSLDILQLN